jgi:hypothetical protein
MEGRRVAQPGIGLVGRGAGVRDRTGTVSLEGWRSSSPPRLASDLAVVVVRVGPVRSPVVMPRRRMRAGGRRCAWSCRAGQQCPGQSYRGR